MTLRIGIDLGGTKLEGIVLDEKGATLARHRMATPRDGYEAILQAIEDLVRHLEKEVGATCSVGIGIPGVISPATGLVKNANTVSLIGHPLDKDLQNKLQREVRLANDANCFVLSEAVDGAAEGAPVVFGVIVGTGTGGGLVVHGNLVKGLNAIAGEWGHNPLPWPSERELLGPKCYCGQKTCIEMFLSGPGLARDHLEQTGVSLKPQEIAEKAKTGDEEAAATMERYVDRMARALASVINLLDPDAIVLGGGLSKLAELYVEGPSRWGQYAFSDEVQTRLVPAKYGDASGVRGAAWLWS